MEIKVLRNVLEANEKAADSVKQLLQSKKIYMVNIMGSPGCGKTTFISALLSHLSQYKTAVIEGDIETTKDAEKLSAYGVPVIQINTALFGGECHLEASWVHSALNELSLDDIDIVFIENVGNLVCPAEFEVGADLSLVILSIPEGEDKPVKYPLMFRTADIIVLSKSSLSEAFEYDYVEIENNVNQVNGQVPLYITDAKKGDGIDVLARLIVEKFEKKSNA